jgi:hypothetical protein
VIAATTAADATRPASKPESSATGVRAEASRLDASPDRVPGSAFVVTFGFAAGAPNFEAVATSSSVAADEEPDRSFSRTDFGSVLVFARDVFVAAEPLLVGICST